MHFVDLFARRSLAGVRLARSPAEIAPRSREPAGPLAQLRLSIQLVKAAFEASADIVYVRREASHSLINSFTTGAIASIQALNPSGVMWMKSPRIRLFGTPASSMNSERKSM